METSPFFYLVKGNCKFRADLNVEFHIGRDSINEMHVQFDKSIQFDRFELIATSAPSLSWHKFDGCCIRGTSHVGIFPKYFVRLDKNKMAE